ncbi:MAG: hypothetical protein HY923_07235 [Elusimicrobia bacterium]|nr:hypothetical protein [Elusimicrobiota bacterium]
MKTRRLMSLLMSAYVSSMLASNVAPIISDAMLAAPIDPVAAQKAFQFAVSGLAAEGFRGSSSVESIAPPSPAVAPSVTSLAADPVMTDELMNRLITRTLASKKDATLNKEACAVLNICDGTKDIPVKQVSSTKPEGKHFFVYPLKEGNKDIIITLKRDTGGDIYLTDKTGTLRAAAVYDGTNTKLITNEAAAEKFKAELKLFAAEAEALPPTGTAVAGNS